MRPHGAGCGRGAHAVQCAQHGQPRAQFLQGLSDEFNCCGGFGCECGTVVNGCVVLCCTASPHVWCVRQDLR